MYKILNKLFGWDYIAWQNFADQGIARVFLACDNKAVYWRYRSSKVLDKIITAEQVIWLTCPPEKYLIPPPPKEER